MGSGDHACGEVVYIDYTIFGRAVYRDLACGRRVSAEDAGRLMSVDSPPLSWYFSFRGMK